MLLLIAFLGEEFGVVFGVRILRGVLLCLLWFLGHPYLVAVVVCADNLWGLPWWPCCGWGGGGGGGAYAVFPLPLHRNPVPTTSNTNTASIPIEPTTSSRRGSSTAPLRSTAAPPHTSPGCTASPSRGVTHNAPHLRCWHVDTPSASHVRIGVSVVRCMWCNHVVMGVVVVVVWLMMLQMLLMVLVLGVVGVRGGAHEVSLRGVWSPITINIIAIPIASSRWHSTAFISSPSAGHSTSPSSHTSTSPSSIRHSASASHRNMTPSTCPSLTRSVSFLFSFFVFLLWRLSLSLLIFILIFFESIFDVIFINIIVVIAVAVEGVLMPWFTVLVLLLLLFRRVVSCCAVGST